MPKIVQIIDGGSKIYGLDDEGRVYRTKELAGIPKSWELFVKPLPRSPPPPPPSKPSNPPGSITCR